MRSAKRTGVRRGRVERRRPLATPRSRVLVGVVIAVLVLGVASFRPGPARAAADCEARSMQTVQAADIAARLASGEPVFLSCVVVAGNLLLTPDMGEIGPLFLIESVLEQGLVAPFVRFGGPVHFDGTCFRGDVNIEGAVFEDEVNWARASFACGGSPAKVFATASRFRGAADLRAAVYSDIDFADASFAARTLLQGVEFRGETTFRGALIEDQISFRGAVFSRFANFENVTAVADVEFSSAEFHDDALFRRFSSPAKLSLRDAKFSRDLTLDRASVSNIDLTRADFGSTLHMADLSAGSLQMTPSLVGRIEHPPTRTEVLRLIERSAKAQDNAGLANSALFQRQSLETRDKSQPRRALWLGIELVTGYLVRPLRPLVAIGVVAFAGLAMHLAIDGRVLLGRLRRMTGARAERNSRSPLVESPDPDPRNRSSWHIVALIAAPAGRAVSAALDPRPPKPDIDETDGSTYAIATLVWTEYLVQKLLVAVFLISLGNANPTIREIITSVL